jgi:hypothetical protein
MKEFKIKATSDREFDEIINICKKLGICEEIKFYPTKKTEIFTFFTCNSKHIGFAHLDYFNNFRAKEITLSELRAMAESEQAEPSEKMNLQEIYIDILTEFIILGLKDSSAAKIKAMERLQEYSIEEAINPKEGEMVEVWFGDTKPEKPNKRIFLAKLKKGCMAVLGGQEKMYKKNEPIIVEFGEHFARIPQKQTIPMSEALEIVAAAKGINVENIEIK